MKTDIYALLGMIKDGKAPKKIKFRDTIYEYWECGKEFDYRFDDKEYACYNFLSSYIGNNYLDVIFEEVEIIEEPKDNKINGYVSTYVLCDSDFEKKGQYSLEATEIIDKAFEEYSHKINEIIDKINKEN